MVKKAGTVNRINDEVLTCVYMKILTRAMRVLIRSDEDIRAKITILFELFLNDKTRSLAEYENFGKCGNMENVWKPQREKLFKDVADFLVGLKDIPDDYTLKYAELGEFVSSAAGFQQGWSIFYRIGTLYLLTHGRDDEARERIKILLKVMPDDAQIKNLAKLFL
jgi:hypothetical protein